MAILNMPDNDFRTLELSLATVQSATRSPWTGRRQVSTNPWLARFAVKAEHAPIIGEANIRPWRAFFASLDGAAERFRVPVTEIDQHAGAVTATVLSSSGPTNLVLTGLTHSVTYLPAGAFLTVPLDGSDEQLVQLKTPLVSDGSGHASASFYPPLHGTADVAAAVETKRPWVVVALDDPDIGYAVAPGQQYSFSIAASEAF